MTKASRIIGRTTLMAPLLLAALVAQTSGLLTVPGANGGQAQPVSAQEGTNESTDDPPEHWPGSTGPVPQLPDGAELAAPDWRALMLLTRADWPERQARIHWRKDFPAARREALRTGRPLFVTIRCLPCEQCAVFDAEVLRGESELGPLLKQFVTVRLTNMRDVDRDYFPYGLYQDLDLSWWGYFHDGSRPIGVFGGRDAGPDPARVSVAALARAMTRVLNAWYSVPRILKPASQSPPSRVPIEEVAGWDAWAALGAEEARSNECLHCHQVMEVLRMPAIEAGTFDKANDFWTWPRPENIGLSLERDDGLLVSSVRAGGPAERAGLRSGDALLGAGCRESDSRPGVGGNRTRWSILFSQADLRGVLHRYSEGAAGASVRLTWVRESEIMEGTLNLDPGWRRSDLSWRKSVADAATGAATGFPEGSSIGRAERIRLGLPPHGLAVRVSVVPPLKGPAARSGLRGDDVMIKINGEAPDASGRQLAVWFRLRFEPGDRIELLVVGPDGERRTLRYLAPRFQE